jgi:PKD repeat protein
MQVTYGDLEPPVVTGTMNVCEGSYTTLTAELTDGQTILWSREDTVVHTGPVFQTQVLNAPVTYTVIQAEESIEQKVGPSNNSFGDGSIHDTNFEGKLLFETYVPVEIISMLVYAQGNGDRVFRLYDEIDNVIWEDTFSLESGDNRVFLNLKIPAAGKYSIGNSAENLYRNRSGANYPYKIDNVLSIYSSNSTTDSLAYYYYFYDWVVKEAPCQSPPSEVTVNVEPGPVAGFLTDHLDLTVTFTDISSDGATSWAWNFGDGSPLVYDQNPVHTYAQEGVYEIELTVSNGSCYSTVRQTIEVDFASLANEPEAAAGLKIYPNPAVDEVTIAFDQATSGKFQLNVMDATGSLAISRSLDGIPSAFIINTSALAAGTYQFQIISEQGVSVRRVIILK